MRRGTDPRLYFCRHRLFPTGFGNTHKYGVYYYVRSTCTYNQAAKEHIIIIVFLPDSFTTRNARPPGVYRAFIPAGKPRARPPPHPVKVGREITVLSLKRMVSICLIALRALPMCAHAHVCNHGCVLGFLGSCALVVTCWGPRSP